MPKKKKPPFDLSLIPGSPREQRDQAQKMLARGQHPIAITKKGSRWQLEVLGVAVGSLPRKRDVCSAAHLVGRYRLDLGDFAFTYVAGWKGCERL